jgi:hypothetical protein
MTNAIALLCMLLVGHFLCDYPLQGDFLARAKNQTAPIPGVPWYQALTAHAAIQAGAVWFIVAPWSTGAWKLALGEFVMHWMIDYRKSAGGLDFDQDQMLHALCKVGWVFVLAMWGTWGPS